MAKFVALYTKPKDVEGFEEHYRTTHLPITQRWPSVVSTSVTRIQGTPRGTEAPYHLMFEAEFASNEEMAAALRSDAGGEAAMDARQMVERFGVEVTMLLGDDF